MKSPSTFAERLKLALDDPEHGMSQAALAKRLGYRNQSAVGNMISDPTRTGSKKDHAIAEALRVELRWLQTGTGPMRKPMEPAAHKMTEADRLDNALLSMFRELSERRRFELYARVALAYEEEQRVKAPA